MVQFRGAEKRRQARFRVAWRLEAKLLKAGLPPEDPAEIIRGTIRNISAGGLGLLCDELLPRLQVLRCEIFPSETFPAIPTLAEVRWVLQSARRRRWKAGLQILL